MFNVRYWYADKGVPPTGSFDSSGKDLLLMVAGSAYGTPQEEHGVDVKIDGVEKCACTMYFNEGDSHKALPTQIVKIKNVPAGNHTVAVVPRPGTVVNSNWDRWCLTIAELDQITTI